MNKPVQISFPAIIEPDYYEGPLRKRFKKTCSIHHAKRYTFPCLPSVVSGGLQHPANLQSPIPRSIFIVQTQRPNVKEDWSIEANVIKRKRAITSPAQNTIPLVRIRPLCAPPSKITSSSLSSTLPLGRPLAGAPSLPRLAAGRAIPRLVLQ
jgi:hypothetical protein